MHCVCMQGWSDGSVTLLTKLQVQDGEVRSCNPAVTHLPGRDKHSSSSSSSSSNSGSSSSVVDVQWDPLSSGKFQC